MFDKSFRQRYAYNLPHCPSHNRLSSSGIIIPILVPFPPLLSISICHPWAKSGSVFFIFECAVKKGIGKALNRRDWRLYFMWYIGYKVLSDLFQFFDLMMPWKTATKSESSFSL